MLIATSLAAVLVGSSAVSVGASSPAASPLPPMVIAVSADPQVPQTLVTRLLDEAGAVWRPAGFTFLWQRTARLTAPHAPVDDAGPYLQSSLRIIIGDERGSARDHRTPLGWI